MKETEAIGLIGSMCIRMMGLMVLIAESSPTRMSAGQRRFVAQQRQWLKDTQDLLELEHMVNDAMTEVDE